MAAPVLAIVEPVFGHIAAPQGMNRSTLRGKAKVNIQWKLYCMVHSRRKETLASRVYFV
jgi:hypothetical protein